MKVRLVELDEADVVDIDLVAGEKMISIERTLDGGYYTGKLLVFIQVAS